MAFISTAFTAGQTLTAASMENLRENANAGHSVFTTEAARDAAITSPVNGMMAYLTAPTVPTSTTGALTLYNGSAWVCLTPQTAEVLTNQAVSSGTYTDLATVGPAVTLVTGTKALVTISCRVVLDALEDGFISAAVSGATTLAASDDRAAASYGSSGVHGHSVASTILYTGLTAGTNTFTCKYKTTGSVDFRYRRITVVGVP